MAEIPQGGDAKRKRLQQLFAHANKVMAKDDFDYATNLLTQCVLEEPANLMYLRTFLANLKKKYGNNKKGARLAFFKTPGARSLVKKASLQKNWQAVIKNGLEILKVNPWDVSTLISMSEASGELDLDEVELAYLMSALEVDMKDVEVNRLCARALADRKMFDQAIACWRRVLQAKPLDEEGTKALGDLAVEKTIKKGGYEDKDAIQKAIRTRNEQATPDRRVDETDEERLIRLLKKNPEDVNRYLELASFYVKDEQQLEKAEKVLAQADKTMPGNPEIRERLEEVRLSSLHARAAQLRTKLEASPSPELERQLKMLQDEIAQKEIQFYKTRCERFPNNSAYHQELGIRYLRNQQFKEAIVELQRAKIDPRRRGVCDLRLGECFQQINQVPLALEHYVAATTEIPDHDLENKKDALYQAGTLAITLQKREAATRYLTSLAGMDYSYRDVSALLDKLARLGDDDGQAS